MPLYRFPRRTNETDNAARVLGLALRQLVADQRLSVQEQFMVSVVALRSGLMAVAGSGSTRGPVLINLTAELGLNGAHPLLTASNENSDLSKRLVDPAFGHALGRIQRATFGPFWAGECRLDAALFAPGRYCAEPKALQQAYETRETALGMTTFWHGPANARGFADYIDPDGPSVGLQLALPCAFCRTNEARIMAYLESMYTRESMQTGAPRRNSM